ncbi:NTP transferase domain-containing protein [Colwellia psychrerythraea]|uniref:MobA-like NTP transferase domain containing protein n=1 Tax=Colwellia psychrerythraea TaxID=28229 RepID=A0A099KKD3_COLPS|nr:phosphocholine cytidylyltransferase family protein [Colwellia psychrerythraea]KGJ90886.1 MobA-like NTP transferase domain containing protein [Colwellia psychrerythraea]
MTRALILAAGEGTRLRPLTNDKPKCMVLLQGRSLIERQIDCLKRQGITDIHIATGYQAEQIVALGYPTSFNASYKQSNMVSTLFCALDFIQQEGDLIIAYGDIVYNDNNLTAVLACDDDITLMIDKEWLALWSLRLENPLADAETLIINDAGYVTELGKKPDSYENIQGQYTGLIKVKAEKVAELIHFYHQLDRQASFDGQNFANMYMTSYLQALIDAGWQVRAALVNNGWLEIDSVNDLEQYELLAQQGKLSEFYQL